MIKFSVCSSYCINQLYKVLVKYHDYKKYIKIKQSFLVIIIIGKTGAKAHHFPRIIGKRTITGNQKLIGIDEIHRVDCSKIENV